MARQYFCLFFHLHNIILHKEGEFMRELGYSPIRKTQCSNKKAKRYAERQQHHPKPCQYNHRSTNILKVHPKLHSCKPFFTFTLHRLLLRKFSARLQPTHCEFMEKSRLPVRKQHNGCCHHTCTIKKVVNNFLRVVFYF